MATALGRARQYAAVRGIELIVIDSAALGSYATVRVGPYTLLAISSTSAASADCGAMVHRACEAIAAAHAVEINVHRSHQMAS